MDGRASRREFLRRGIGWVVAPALVVPSAGRSAIGTVAGIQASPAGRGAVGTLRDPTVTTAPRAPTDPEENEAEIQAIETRLECNCGCTLDVFTCRTTDFSCTYSPRLHREVLALRSQGKTAQQVLDAFVAKYGEKALMAPKPRGFNLAGYLVPGAVIAAAGAALVLVIGRRGRLIAAGGSAAASDATLAASPEELERLRQALAEVED